jgi:hypothetical protein
VPYAADPRAAATCSRANSGSPNTPAQTLLTANSGLQQSPFEGPPPVRSCKEPQNQQAEPKQTPHHEHRQQPAAKAGRPAVPPKKTPVQGAASKYKSPVAPEAAEQHAAAEPKPQQASGNRAGRSQRRKNYPRQRQVQAARSLSTGALPFRDDVRNGIG